MAERWSNAQMYRLARSGAVKCDIGGIRGATLVSTEEQLAMAAVLLTSGALPTQAQLNQMIAAEEIEDATIVTETPKAKEA
ncbi:hypothetical protein [Marivita sp.]|uniref:hypothetical protein n=1 Tax=Marivita sp. TaxID=2003365 RepID=UPI003F6F3D7E